MKRHVEIPDDVEVVVDSGILKAKCGDKEVVNNLTHPLIDLTKEGKKILIEPKKENAKLASITKTFESKIKNAITGVREGFEYKLKVVYKHFPMEVNVNGDRLVVSNFLGEKKDREAKILDSVDVKVEDEDVIVSGPDKEKVGQTAANIERNMQSPNEKDRRVFEDGLYIVQKPSKEEN